jgi:ABC-type transport system involved in cytochrome c biogenesis permease subunit
VLGELDRQAKLADEAENAVRSSFQRAVIQLRDAVAVYQRLQNSVAPADDPSYLDGIAALEAALDNDLAASGPAPAAPHIARRFATIDSAQLLPLSREFTTMESLGYFRAIPPASPGAIEEWRTVGAAWNETLQQGTAPTLLMTYSKLGRAWRDQDVTKFNHAVAEAQDELARTWPRLLTKMNAEARFNQAQPFYSSALLYLGAFLLGIVSWLRWPEMLRRGALNILSVAFVLSTVGIGVRMWLESRPPVTNLYSSALFVGWGAVGLCLTLEAIFKNAIGSVVGGLIGFAALVIAHHLALGGDTLEMMRAVLDSNFWLATHVVTVTVGYSATFLAGFLGVVYVLRGTLTRSLDPETAKALLKMIHGVVCFATLFSFVGTVLGGIWADQSWGRFWGWDPKENGALLIVMWNSIVLHARWGGLVRDRGLAALVIFGNVVTAWSWFGVNMLGVGLHSYGFMDAAFWWLIAFVVTQVLVIALAMWPITKWRSAVIVHG